MKKKHLEFTIINQVFKREVLVIANCSIDEANKILQKRKNKYFISKKNNTAGCLVMGNYDVYNILYLENLNKSITSMGELVHEIVHLVIRLCEDKGIPIISNIQTGEVGDEAFAYNCEFYFNAIMAKAFPNSK